MSWRRARSIITLVVAAYVLNHLVTVACAFWSTLGGVVSDGFLSASDGLEWPGYLRSAGWPAPNFGVRHSPGFGIDVLQIARISRHGHPPGPPGEIVRTRSNGPTSVTFVRYESGWPARSAQWHCFGASGPQASALLSEAARHALWYEGLHPPNFIPVAQPRSNRRVPLVPIFRGALLNTALYALLIGPLFFGLVPLRRRWRAAHGRCPRCGYPVGRSDTCSECGSKLPAGHVVQPLPTALPAASGPQFSSTLVGKDK